MKAMFYDLVWDKYAKPEQRLNLSVKGEDGEIYTEDIREKVLKETGKEGITESLYERVYDVLDYEVFTVTKAGKIKWTSQL